MADKMVVLANALHPQKGAVSITLHEDDQLIGAASYRVTTEGIKIANIVSMREREGVGTILFNAIKRRAYDGRIWCQSDPESIGFYEKMGMKRCELLPDGRIIYRGL